MKPKAIIVDIDGTLSNNDHRRHFVDANHPINEKDRISQISLENTPYPDEKGFTWRPDWKSFNEQMVNDTPNEWCVTLVTQMSVPEWGYPPAIIFVTGREECFRSITECKILKWTRMCVRDNQCQLFMRPTKDYRADTVIKREIYENHIKDKYDILFCIDDRQSIVDMWRSLGLTVLQCAKGDF